MKKNNDKKTIFKAIFFPMFIIMIIQSVIFYLVAIYGGIEDTLINNSESIMYERLNTRKAEVEYKLNNINFNFDNVINGINSIYQNYEHIHGNKPLTSNIQNQIEFLNDTSNLLINTLRQNETNGIFLIINNKETNERYNSKLENRYYGLCIRDLDQDNNYLDRSDLLLERSPSALVDLLDCPLDSWWEAMYDFESKENGDYYYYPLEAAWENPKAKSKDLAYFANSHQISKNDSHVVSYSVPLITKDGYPYGVVGVELTDKYLKSLLPGREVSTSSNYLFAYQQENTNIYKPIVGNGDLYDIYFYDNNSNIPITEVNELGGFYLTLQNSVDIYADIVTMVIYNNNSPFENNKLVIISLAESDILFAYIDQIKIKLLIATIACLLIGIFGILLVSRSFATPIKNLAKVVKNVNPKNDFILNRLGILEIDQLVNAIDELNKKANKTSARTEFFSRMSHDLRTPMNAIISFSSPEMLEDANLKTKDDYLNKIHDSSVYMLGLINEVLDMTKIESNNIDLVLRTINLSTICDTVISMAKELAKKKLINFSYLNEIDNDLCVIADKQRINQIILNLLSNAIKFTNQNGNVKLITKTIIEEQNDIIHYIVIVEDTGIGMSKSFLEKLYTPFEQENNSKEGTGLGLTISKKLVDFMNGKLTCVSTQNVGTSFTMDLPLIRSKEEVKDDQTDIIINKNNYQLVKGIRTLICEDNELNALIVLNLLTKWGIKCDIVENGKLGVEKFSNSDVDYYNLILMDIRMPVMDGLEASKAIRNLNRSDAKIIPIIAMTADAFDEDMQACIKAGMNYHLTKPIEASNFFSTILKYVNKK